MSYVTPTAAPLLAWRHARIFAKVGADLRVFGAVFGAITTRQTFTANQQARCLRQPSYDDLSHVMSAVTARELFGIDGHPAPEEGCTCGFYSLKDRERITSRAYSSGLRSQYDELHDILLQVELYGRVIEGEKGHRAEGQIVQTVHLPTRCRVCETREVVGVVVEHNLEFSLYAEDVTLHQTLPACAECGEGVGEETTRFRRVAGSVWGELITLDQLENMLGTEVRTAQEV